MTGEFQVRTKVLFGTAAWDAVCGLGLARACLICDPFLAENGRAGELQMALESAGTQCEIFSEVTPDPTIGVVAEGVGRIVRFQPDAVIALGGGSAIDTAKAVSSLYTRLSGKEKPLCIVIPTTSGTGSEVTGVSVISDPEQEEKSLLSDEGMLPDIAVLDPALTASVPPQVTTDTGMDVLTHALEAYVSPQANDFTDALAEKACELVWKWLPIVFQNGENIEAREHLQNASCMAGMAFNHSSLGLCHGMAHALGAHTHLPHGRCNALLLPHVVAFNAGLGIQGTFPAVEKYAGIAGRLGVGGSGTAAVHNLCSALEKRNIQMGISGRGQALPSPLVEKLVLSALRDRCTGQNIRRASQEDITRIFKRIFPSPLQPGKGM